MSKSVRRVEDHAKELGLEIKVERMPESTRTAEEAASACGCAVGQIVKSLIFKGAESGNLKLLLVSGDHQVAVDIAHAEVGEGLERANPQEVRDITGFAIGGVSPLGHLTSIDTFMDETLLNFEEVWAAAGAPNAVFKINPSLLLEGTGAKKIKVL